MDDRLKPDYVKILNKTSQIDAVGYIPPITLICNDYAMQIEKKIEGTVLSAVSEIGVDIDKERLIKILDGDRKSYDDGYRKGFEDGQKEVYTTKVVSCKGKEKTLQGYLDEKRQLVFLSYVTVEGLRCLGYDITEGWDAEEKEGNDGE